MKVNLHRILLGSPEHRGELVAAGVFVAVWFAMDYVQWVDWIYGKINPTQQQFCVPIDEVAVLVATAGNPKTMPVFHIVQCPK